MSPGWICLIVFGSIFFLFFFLLSTKIKLRLIIRPDFCRANLSYLFFCKHLTDETGKFFEHKKKKKGDVKKTVPEESEKKGKKKPRDIPALISRLTWTAEKIADRFPNTFSLRTRRVIVTVGTDDAAKTALLYGGVQAALTCLFELIDRLIADVRTKGRDVVEVRADFLSGKCDADVDLKLDARLSKLLKLAWIAFKDWLSQKRKRKKKKKGTKPKSTGSALESSGTLPSPDKI